jgi:hypothetical protein
MKINSKSAAILVIFVIFGGILLLNMNGLWITEGRKIPSKINEGIYAGMSNPADIKGSYTFNDIEQNFSIPSTLLAQAFALELSQQEASSYQVKGLETIYGEIEGIEGEIGTDSVRLFVALFLHMEYESEESTYLPSTAIKLLLDMDKISEEKALELYQKSYTPNTIPEENDQTLHSATSVPIGTQAIKGSTTFAELIEWGVTTEEIEKIIGNPIESKLTTVRDYAIERGEEFSVYKEALQAILDSL